VVLLLAVIIVSFTTGREGDSSKTSSQASSQDWWYNHQERIPPEAGCDSEIDFVIKFPGSWAIDELDCEEVLVKRRDNKALAFIHVIRDGRGNVQAKMESQLAKYQRGVGATTGGGASSSGPVQAYMMTSTPGLAYSYNAAWIARLGGCEGDVKVEDRPVGHDIDAAEYRLHLAASVCDGNFTAKQERNAIFDTLRFPGVN